MVIELDILLQTHAMPRSHIPMIKNKRRASLAPSTMKDSDSHTDKSTGIIEPSNKSTTDVFACTPNGMSNDDKLNEPADDVSLCAANRMFNDDDFIQPSDDRDSSSEDVFTFTKKHM